MKMSIRSFAAGILGAALWLLCLSGPALAAEFVVTRSAGGAKSGYPLKVPEGAFVELVQVGGLHTLLPGLRVRFTDGRVFDNLSVSNQTHHGLKFAGVSQIEFPGNRDHVIQWKITPATEFGEPGSTYVSVIPGLPAYVAGAGYKVPAGHSVRILRAVDSAGEGVDPGFASVRLDSAVPGLGAGGLIRTPSEAFPSVTDFYCDTLTLIEVRAPATEGGVTLTVEKSDDLRQWTPLQSFEVPASESAGYFRTSIRR